MAKRKHLDMRAGAAPSLPVPPVQRHPPAHTAAAASTDDDLLDALCQFLTGQLPHVAHEIRAAVDAQRRVWGGAKHWVRSVVPEERERMRRDFLAAFNGANKRELMRQYGISRSTAQRWIEFYYRQRRGGSAHPGP
jgi:hypothetical protein